MILGHGGNFITKFQNRIISIQWTKALWLDAACHKIWLVVTTQVTSFNQSKYIFSEYFTREFSGDIGSYTLAMHLLQSTCVYYTLFTYGTIY